MIPDFQSFMRPLLQNINDGKVHDFNDVFARVCEHFALSPEEISQRLPSGKQTVARNRAAWARTYMGKAGLITSPMRRHMQITERGLAVLQQIPERITVKFLKAEFEEFAQFHTARSQPAAETTAEASNDADEVSDPSERLEQAFQEIHDQLSVDLLAQLKLVDPVRFEQVVVDLMLAMGYGGWSENSGEATQYGGDGGIDGHRLANLMINHGLGVSTKQTIEIKTLDSDYFVED